MMVTVLYDRKFILGLFRLIASFFPVVLKIFDICPFMTVYGNLRNYFTIKFSLLTGLEYVTNPKTLPYIDYIPF